MNIQLKLKIIEHFRTQEKFAVESGINEAVVSKVIRGVRKPTPAQIKIFSRLLKTPAPDLFEHRA